MAYSLSSSFNIPITRHPFFHHTKSPSRIFCFTKNQLGQCDDDTSLGITQRIMKTVIPILIASTIQFSSMVPYVSSPVANAILYSPDTKVPRTGEVALRRAIPASPNMKAIQVSTFSIMHIFISINLSVLFEFLLCSVGPVPLEHWCEVGRKLKGWKIHNTSHET